MSKVRPANIVKGDYQVISSFENIVSMIKEEIRNGKKKIAIEFYPLTNESLLKEKLVDEIGAGLVINAKSIFISPVEMAEIIKYNVTDNRIFGVMSNHKFKNFIDIGKLNEAKEVVEKSEDVSIVYGVGSSFLDTHDLLLYVDLPRWEVQKRYSTGRYSNWNTDNAGGDPQRMQKQGYFFEWNLADNHKKNLFKQVDYILDVVNEEKPKMMAFNDYHELLKQVASQPFSLVPYFAPGIWGGHWMQEKFDIGKDKENLAWSFHGVPEENSLLLSIGSNEFETPANNLVFLFGEEILGERVFGRFGYNFPIRFNLLDTWGGQNLSLQVHPKVDYAQNIFGAHYTQDESYYILDAADDAVVYLGVNNGVEKDELVSAFKEAESGEVAFDDEKYIYRSKMHKHDHYLIPSGTIHSSGKNSVVLEISATPNRFTFKLWDWGRVDFDGLPRPINLEHGEANIDIYKDKDWVESELINQFEVVSTGEGWVEERTGLHETEFIETRRFTFSNKTDHETAGSVNVLSLVEGEQALVTSRENEFEPFVVSYAQTFIIPNTVGRYSIEPYGEKVGEEFIIIKAYVR